MRPVSWPLAHSFIMTYSVILAVIETFMRTQGWTEQDVRQQILDVYNDNEVSSFSAVDLTSIMM